MKPWMRKPWVWIVGAVLLLAIIGALVDGDDPEQATPPATTTTAAAPTTAADPTTEAAPVTSEPVAATNCLAVDPVAAQGLAESMHADAKVTKSAAVKSTVANTHVIVIEVEGGPFESDRAAFETVDIDRASSTRSIDGFAKEFTGFPESAYTIGDQDVKDAYACLDQAD